MPRFGWGLVRCLARRWRGSRRAGEAAEPARSSTPHLAPPGAGVSSETGVPIKWSRSEHVRWRVPLPDRGNSTPIVWADRVFVTQAIEKEGRRTVMCFDRSDGKVLWQSGVSYTEKEATHSTN